MKKFATMILAFVMVLAMSIPAFAAESPEIKHTIVLKWEETDESAEGSLEQAGVKGKYELVDVKEVYVEVDGERVAHWDEIITGTIKVKVKKNDKLVCVHKTNGKWVKEKITAGDGFVTVTLKGCSPVAIYREVEDSQAGSSSTGNGTSPKTGESTAVFALMAMMAIAAVGMIAFRKRVA